MLPRSAKQAVAMLVDAGIVAAAVWGAFALRLADPWPEMLSSRWWLLIAMPMVTIVIFKLARLYRTVVRHLGPQFGLALLYGVTFSALCMPLMVLLVFLDDYALHRLSHLLNLHTLPSRQGPE